MIFDDSTVSDQPLFYVTPRRPQQPQRSGFQVLAIAENAEQRLATCETCEHYRKRLRQCSLCNCIMPVKVRFQKASCPDGRW